MKRNSLFLGIAAVAILAGCTERESILPGKREDLRAILNDAPVAETAPRRAATQLRLPKAQANAEWTHGLGTQKYRVTHASLSEAPQPVWSAEIGAGDGRRNRITADPVIAAGRVYTLDAESQVVATSLQGARLWQRDLVPARDHANEATGGGLAYGAGRLFVTSGFGFLTALDPETGAVLWQQDLNSTGSGAPTVYGDLVYVVGGDDTGWALEVDTGRIRWQTSQPGDVNNVLGAPAPAINDKFAIFAYGDGALDGNFRNGGLRMWTSYLSGQRREKSITKVTDITSAPVIDGDTIYVGSHSGRLLALDITTGERKWTATEGAISPVLPVSGALFAVTDQNDLVRLDAEGGALVWSVKLPNFVKYKQRRASEVYAHHGPILAGGQLIVASNDGFLRFYDPSTGAQTRELAVPGGATTAPVVAGGTLYVVSTKGKLHAFR